VAPLTELLLLLLLAAWRHPRWALSRSRWRSAEGRIVLACQ